jgi:hypothetical protein
LNIFLRLFVKKTALRKLAVLASRESIKPPNLLGLLDKADLNRLIDQLGHSNRSYSTCSTFKTNIKASKWFNRKLQRTGL